MRPDESNMKESALRIAVVDDDEAVLRAIKRLLRTTGAEVDTFGSGEEFLSSLDSHRPDCVVLDVQMHGMHGLEVQAALNAKRDPPPVVFMTAREDEGAQTQAMSRGASAFLHKPLSDEVLIRAIDSVMRIELTIASDDRPQP